MRGRRSRGCREKRGRKGEPREGEARRREGKNVRVRAGGCQAWSWVTEALFGPAESSPMKGPKKKKRGWKGRPIPCWEKFSSSPPQQGSARNGGPSVQRRGVRPTPCKDRTLGSPAPVVFENSEHPVKMGIAGKSRSHPGGRQNIGGGGAHQPSVHTPARSPAQAALASELHSASEVTGLCRPTKVLAGHSDQHEGMRA